MHDTLARLRSEEFGAVTGVYLNHASLGTLPARTVQALSSFDADRARRGSASIPDLKPVMERARSHLARWIGADTEEVAFTTTTPAGISLVASGLDWRQGDNVVTTALEFPANIYPWLNLERSGVDVRIVPSVDWGVPFEDIAEAVDARTRVVAVSWVTFSNGFRFDLARLGEFCRARDIYLVVDAIQGLGCVPLDVHDAQIDFLAAAAHKWMLSPYGTGCFYCRRDLIDQLQLSQVGQNSVIPTENYLTYRYVPKPDASRFEPGVPNFGAIAGLDASLSLLAEAGSARIWEQVLATTTRLANGLRVAGYQVISPRGPTEASGIVSFMAADPGATQRVFDQLEEEGIIVSLREGAVRVAPHFYNTHEEIDALLACLPRRGA
jgi:selenocysteine lyase/cysteine desulfurase